MNFPVMIKVAIFGVDPYFDERMELPTCFIPYKDTRFDHIANRIREEYRFDRERWITDVAETQHHVWTF